jgi:hypothetical protein
MKKTFLIYLLILAATASLAGAATYTCTSSKNEPLFARGDSSVVTLEVASSTEVTLTNGAMSLPLQNSSHNGGYSFFRVSPDHTALVEIPVEAVVQDQIINGSARGQMDLIKSGTEFEQHYSCIRND